jgi:hypothetical protein
MYEALFVLLNTLLIMVVILCIAEFMIWLLLRW